MFLDKIFNKKNNCITKEFDWDAYWSDVQKCDNDFVLRKLKKMEYYVEKNQNQQIGAT